MKDLEKIKSEDLACQVADANPGNFAIEQEVAQLVGATLPAPTEPSADDARELGAQLLVFLRRALLPIRSALRTALAAIYAHLDSRCTDYTPAAYAPYQPLPSYDPMGTPPTPRTLPNLLTALTAFAPRKISNGSAPNDGIPDGVSLAHLIFGSDAYNAVLEIKDDNPNWTMSKAFSGFPNIKRLTILGNGYLGNKWIANMASLEELNIPNIQGQSAFGSGDDTATMPAGISNLAKLKRLHAEGFSSVAFNGNGNQYSAAIAGCPELEEVWLGRVTNTDYPGWGGTKWVIQYCQAIVRISVESMVEKNCLVRSGQNANLIDLEIRGIQANSCNLSWWNPTDKGTTFLQNFKEHIALRLTSNGSGKTLTLSQAVFDTIWNQDGTPKSTDPDSVIYQINKIIKTDKHWSVNRA